MLKTETNDKCSSLFKESKRLNKDDNNMDTKKTNDASISSSSVVLNIQVQPNIVVKNVSTRYNAIQDVQNQSENHLVTHYNIEKSFKPFDERNFNKFKRMLRDKQIVVFQLESDGKFSIIWRKSMHEVYAVNIFQRNIQKEDLGSLCNYIQEFISDCLKQNHSGLSKTNNSSNFNIDIASLAATNNMNLLLHAASKGHTYIIPILLDVAFSVNMSHNDFIVAAHAYSNLNFDTVIELLKRDSIFPPGITNQNCLSDKIKEFAQKSQKLNEHIKTSNLDEIRRILSENPNLRAFHNIKNQSASAVAIIYKKFDVYELLLQSNMCLSVWEDINEITKDLSGKEKDEIHEIHFKNKKDLDNHHLNVLMSKCSVGHDVQNAQNYLEHVMRAFRVLNGFNVIQILLKIAALLPNLEIVFDFNHNSINYLDPNQDRNNAGMFYCNGRIYVGAKQLLDSLAEHEVFATIAHELCHFVLYMLFKNYAKPYNQKDSETEEEFEAISVKCEKKKKVDEIIRAVYDFYEDTMHHTELIVRIPHFFGHYFNQPEMIEKLRVHFGSLFDFYELKLLPKLDEKLTKLKAKAEKKRKAKDKKISMLIISLVVGFIVMFLVAALITYWVYEPTYNWEDLDDEQKMKVFNGNVTFEGIDLKFYELYGLNDSSNLAFKNLTSQQIKTFLNDEILNLNEAKNIFLQDEIYLVYNNLSESLKDKVQNSKIDLQGQLVIISSLFNNDTEKYLESLNYKQIVGLIKNKPIKIGQKFENDTEIYIERKLIKRNMKNNVSTDINVEKGHIRNLSKFSSDLLNKSLNEKIILLSDNAGLGKTTEFKSLAQKLTKEFPLKWIKYVDLKSKIDVFKKYQKRFHRVKIIQVLINIFDVENFEEFKMLYNDNNVIIFWDGFDEISPNYSDFLLTIMQNIKSYTLNIQFVSTRPYYERDIQGLFNCTVFEFSPFSKKDNDLFIINYYAFKNLTETQMETSMKNIRQLINVAQVNDSDDDNPVIASPLFMQMIIEASIVDDDLNLYMIFESFTSIKLEISNDKGKIAENEKNQFLLQGLNLKEILQYFAIKMKFGSTDLPKPLWQKYQTKTFDLNELYRYGILILDLNNNTKFFHSVFEDFFVAQYIVENIYNRKDESNCTHLSQIFVWFNDHLYFFEKVKTKKFLLEYLRLNESRSVNENLIFCFKNESDLNLLFFTTIKKAQYNDILDTIRTMLDLFPYTTELLEVLWHINGDETFFMWLAKEFSIQYRQSLNKIEEIIAEYFPIELEKQQLLYGKNYL